VTKWEVRPLGEVCRVVNGGTPKTSVLEYWGGEHRWITPAEMGKRSSPYVADTSRKLTSLGLSNCSASLSPANSVILSTRAPIGHLVINTEPMATNQGCRTLVPGSGIHEKYLYFYLDSIRDVLDALGTGATFRELSAGVLKSVTIPVPSLPEQQNIFEILEEVFEAIATARENAEKSIRNARALFKRDLRSIVAEAWEAGELVTLSSLATDITDGDHMPPPKAPTGVPFITIRNVMKDTGKIDFSETFMVPSEYFEDLKDNKKPRKGDVLYTVTGSFGIPVLVERDVEFCFQRHIALVRPKPETDSAWLYYLLMSPQVFDQADERATGTAQRTVSLGVLRSLVVPAIPLPQQRAAAARLEILTQETQRLAAIYQRKLAALDELKKSLLHQAFSGQL